MKWCKNCKLVLSVFLFLTSLAITVPALSAITGTVHDGTPSPGMLQLWVVALKHNPDFHPALVDIHCIAFPVGSFPDYIFSLDCEPGSRYDIAVVSWKGTGDSPDAVTDFRTNIPSDTAGIVLSIIPNSNQIAGRLLEFADSITSIPQGEVWCFDTLGNIVGLAFNDSSGNYSFDYLPAGIGSYVLKAITDFHLEDSLGPISNPASGKNFYLKRTFESHISNSSGTGFQPINQEHARWVTSDARNFYFTFKVEASPSALGGDNINWVMLRAPGGLIDDSNVRFFLPTSGDSIGPELDWNSIVVNTSGQRDQVIFTPGTGTQVIAPNDSATFIVKIDSMTNVAQDEYPNWDILVSSDGGQHLSRGSTDVAQKVLQIKDIIFSPAEADSGFVQESNNITATAIINNHGTATIYLYDNWSSMWSSAFAFAGGKILSDSILSQDSGSLSLSNIIVTTVVGNHPIYASTADSFSTWVDYLENIYVWRRGDVTGDGIISSSDIVFLINYFFKSKAAPVPLVSGDVNCSGGISSADIVALINYFFKSRPLPCR